MVNNLATGFPDCYKNAATSRLTLNDVPENNRIAPVFLNHNPDSRCRGYSLVSDITTRKNVRLFFDNPILDIL